MTAAPRWILELEHIGPDFEQNRVFRHADCKGIYLLSRLKNSSVIYQLCFAIPYGCGWIDCESWTKHTSVDTNNDPNTDDTFCDDIDQEAEKVIAFLERVPEFLDKVSQFCKICGTDINSLPLATHNHPTPHQSALWHFQHFCEAHAFGSTVKSALKQ